MKVINLVALVLLVIGGLNWGLIAINQYDLVASIAGLDFGETNTFTRIVYGLVGLSAVVVAVNAAVWTAAMGTTRDRTTIR
jgi:uncharacterized membrane protein YuzA (DUF378 family)